MHRQRLLIAITSALGMLAGMELLSTPLTIAPPASCSSVETLSGDLSLAKGDKNRDRCATGMDFALYNRGRSPGESLSQPSQILWQQLEVTQARQKNGFSLYGDTNRDGVVDEKDYPKRDKWSWKTGALMLFNNDDDRGNSLPDWQDELVNGDKDVEDLAKVHLKVGSDFAGAQLLLVADEKARPHINVFQKTDTGWELVGLEGGKSLIYSRDILLGVEAKQFADKNWNGLLTLQAIAQKNGKILASDEIQLRVTPWIMLPNTAPVAEFYVSDRGIGNREFVSQIYAGVKATGAEVNVVPGGTTWKQDTMEIGYVQFPDKSQLRNFNVVLQGNRPQGMDTYARSLLSRDFGWFEIGKPRQLDALNQWTDGYGNLEVTPPLGEYPLGRIYYGNTGNVIFHPDVLDFLKAQEIQSPPVDIDTSWLMIRHVDEIISFIATPSGKYLLLIVSPESGVNLLKELKSKGYGNELINRGLSTQTTVQAALDNKNLIEYNLKLQSDRLNPILAKLKQEFQLADEQIIPIPTMFGYGGYSWWPNMVNSVTVNNHLLVSNPHGAVIDGKDYTQQAFRQKVAHSGLRVYFLEDRYYHELRGNAHTATNTKRQATDRPFWKTLPSGLDKR